MSHDPIVIVSAARTPMGGFQGSMASFTASELGAHAIQQAVLRAGHPTLSEKVDEVIMGCVLPAGQHPRHQPAHRDRARLAGGLLHPRNRPDMSQIAIAKFLDGLQIFQLFTTRLNYRNTQSENL